jgi:hypothetical protein
MSRTPRHAKHSFTACRAGAITTAFVLCALLAPLPAAAALTYGAKASLATNISVWGQPQQQQGRLDPVSGDFRESTNDAVAGGTLEARARGVSGDDLFTQAFAIARANSGTVSASASSQSMTGLWVHDRATATAGANARMQLDSLVTGAPGSVGKAVVTGWFWARASGGPLGGLYALNGGANIGLNAFMQSFAPGSAGCGQTSCKAYDGINANLTAGQSIVGGNDRAWRLEIDVRAGDMLMLLLTADATVSAGGGASLTMVPPTGPLGAAQSLSFADMLHAAVPASSSMTGLWLSPGLQLADTSGLVPLGDGSYGFATPVPEPATWLSLLGGLVLLGARRFARRDA